MNYVAAESVHSHQGLTQNCTVAMQIGTRQQDGPHKTSGSAQRATVITTDGHVDDARTSELTAWQLIYETMYMRLLSSKQQLMLTASHEQNLLLLLLLHRGKVVADDGLETDNSW